MTPIFHSSATYVYVWNKRKILKFKIGFCGVIYGVHVSPSTRALERNIIWAEKNAFWQILTKSEYFWHTKAIQLWPGVVYAAGLEMGQKFAKEKHSKYLKDSGSSNLLLNFNSHAFGKDFF